MLCSTWASGSLQLVAAFPIHRRGCVQEPSVRASSLPDQGPKRLVTVNAPDHHYQLAALPWDDEHRISILLKRSNEFR